MSIMTIMGATVFASDYESISNESDVSYYNSVASRASNYFTGQTGTMNALYNSSSGVFNISSGSVLGDGKVSNVKLVTTVSSGSSPCYLVVTSPSGTKSTTLIGSSGTINLSNFNGEAAKGSWGVYITTLGTVSTVSARMTVDYTY